MLAVDNGHSFFGDESILNRVIVKLKDNCVNCKNPALLETFAYLWGKIGT